jgi:hypothetical protein
MTIYPFLLSANRSLDYRIILLPRFVQNTAEIGSLTRILDGFLQQEASSGEGIRLQDQNLGHLTIWYEKVVGRSGGTEMIDRAGRKIYRIQGFVEHNVNDRSQRTPGEVDALKHRVRAEANAAFELFLGQRASFSAITSNSIEQARDDQDMKSLYVRLENLEKKVEVLRGPSQSAPTEAVKIAILATVLIAVVALVVDVLLALSLSRERALRTANIQSELAPVRAVIGGIKHRVDELEVQGSNKK